MRLFGLSLAAFLLFPWFALGQHTTSTPPPPPPPHTAPSPPSPPHVSAPPAPHIAAPSPTPSHVSSPPAAHSGGRASDRINPDHKITSDPKIASAPRVGEDSPEASKKKTEEKPDPDLRRRVCVEGNCKVEKKEPDPEPDLRRRVCVDGKCSCPAGETESKGGCVPAPAPAPAPSRQQAAACKPGKAGCPETACLAGQTWNGVACAPAANQCAAGQVWNGTSCLANCSIVTTEAQGLITELRSAHQKRDDACRQDPGALACTEATNRYATILSEYQNLLGGVAPECRTQVPDPSTI